MALNIINTPFINLTYQQGQTTYFSDTDTISQGTNYYKLVGNSASDATLTSVSPAPSNGNLIPPKAVVFIEMSDHSTLIIKNLKYFARPSSGGSSDGGYVHFRGAYGFTDIIDKVDEDLYEMTSYSDNDYIEGDMYMVYDGEIQIGAWSLYYCSQKIRVGGDEYRYKFYKIYDGTDNYILSVNSGSDSYGDPPTDSEYNGTKVYNIGDVYISSSYTQTYSSGSYVYSNFKLTYYVLTNKVSRDEDNKTIWTYTWTKMGEMTPVS